MCGIVGVISKRPIRDREILIRQRDKMSHRGPDDAGVWWSEDGCVGLAHRRLAVIDPSLSGHQPMRDRSGKVLIVFNGMIYNFIELREELRGKGHSFGSSSDTEVILAAYLEWGIDCLKRLNGMFAFGIYDGNKKQFFLARDRAGEKPLFYRLNNGEISFASELKALMADPEIPRRINAAAFDSYLAFGYIPGELCILEGINKLPPAHFLALNLDSRECRIERYWHLPDQPSEKHEAGQMQENDLANELEGLLEDTVSKQLISDVPIGIMLSGGIDSSLITAMAARKSSKIKTFTVCFPGYEKYNETEHARLVARHFDTDHIEMEASNVGVSILPVLAKQYDEPMADSSMIPTYLVSKLVRQHCTVALGGDGGDELFAGYPRYDRLLRMSRNVRRIPQFSRICISRMAEHMVPVGVKGRNWLKGANVDLDNELPHIGWLFNRKDRIGLLKNADSTHLVAEEIWKKRTPSNVGILQRATRMDFENYLAEDILVKVDRASMLNSLEVRAPLLDHRVIEFAFGKLPQKLRATPLMRKIILKKIVSEILPPQFDIKRKQGLVVPLGSWLTGGEWKEYFREILVGESNNVFNMGFIQSLIRSQKLGFRNSERLFALVMFELWRREYNVSF